MDGARTPLTESDPVTVGISIGDANGIGPEVILKALSDPRIFEYITPVLYGSASVLSFYSRCLDGYELQFHQLGKGETPYPHVLNLVEAVEGTVEVEPGRPTRAAGDLAVRALGLAADAATKGLVDALVTAPINKHTVRAVEFDFPGHTEYLAWYTGAADVLMMMVAENLRVGVLTGHVPLRSVPELLTRASLRSKLELFHEALCRDFGLREPRIAVTGLNPHAGESGMLGSEEEDVLIPVIDEVANKGQVVLGPYAADGLFGSAMVNKFDGILAMYHDQGLAPFKSRSFQEGVNFSAGLPIIRTSPDHGTGYEIAGSGRASEHSFRQAILLARDLFRQRSQTAKIDKMS